MFKRLRTKIAEEAQRFPIQVGETPADNETFQAISSQTEQQDLIDLKSNAGNAILQPESEQFSINDEDDSNPSEPNSPYRTQENISAGKEASYSSTPVTLTVAHPECTNPVVRGTENPAFQIQYKMQTDTESEREEPIELEAVSKEQLLLVIQKLRNRIQKYKIHYKEVITACKEVSSEKEKLQRALSDTQDKTLRRLAELREQCQLEQQAKAHLEQNLQMMLDEKEQMIYVLETKVHLLKEGNYSEKEEINQCENLVCSPDVGNKSIKEEDIQENGGELQSLREKIKRQEALLAKCKDTIKSNKERTTQLIDEKNNLLEQLDQKTKEQKDFQVQEAEIQSDLQAELLEMREKLSALEKQQEENAMAMAETKRNMHEELELREQQLCKLKSELQNVQQEKELLQKSVEEQELKYIDLQNKHEEAVSSLQSQLEITENNMEKERENLMHELSRGKAAALNLVKEECGRKINIIEEEWKLKIETLKQEHKMALEEKEKENEKALIEQEEEFRKLMDERNKEKNFAFAEQSVQTTELEIDIQKDDLQKEVKSNKLKEDVTDESLLVAEENQLALLDELDSYKYQVAELYRILDQLRAEKMKEETELKQKLETLQCENNKLNDDVNTLNNLQREKEDIDNKLKEMKDNSNKNDEILLALQEECKKLKEECAATIELKQENGQLKIKLNELERDKEEIKCTLQHEFMKIQSDKRNVEEELRKTKIRMELLNQKSIPKECDDSDSLLKEENVLLKEQLNMLETQTFGISHVDNYQNQLTTIKNNYEEKLKAKDMELSSKLKQMVRDFTSQMEQKETEYEKTLSTFIAEKGQVLEGKMERKHREEMAALEQELYEKSCALEDVTEHYQQLFCEKEDELKNCKDKIKETGKCENDGSINESNQDVLQTEANDWEEGWMDAEDSTSVPQQITTTEVQSQENLHCTEHLQYIKTLESSIANSQEEIAELRFLLGLTDSSGSSSNANYNNEISLKLPEPTEFEYLRNILYEYMTGKEPMILARVIAAVLKFSEEQTHEILQRESVRQTLRNY